MADQNKLQIDFSGGMNVYKAPLVLKDNECELMLNYNHDRPGALTKRSGLLQAGTQINDNEVRVLATGNNNIRIAVVFNDGAASSGVWRWDGSAWTLWRTSYTDNSARIPANFETYLDYTFMVANNVDMASTDSTTLDSWSSDNCPDPADDPQCKYIKRFGDRMYIANGTGGTSRIYWSSLPDSVTGELTWDIDNDWADIDPDSNSPIVGLDVNGGKLLVFKTDALFRWQFGVTDADRVIGVGAFNQRSIKTNYELGITFFAGKYGIYSYSPFSEARPRLISRPIQRWFNAISISNRERVQLELDIDNVYVYGGTSVTLDGRTIQNPFFVYNIPMDAWSMYSIATTAMGSTSVVAMGSFSPVADGTSASNLLRSRPAVHIGDAVGNVYQMNSGTSDNGAPIATDFVSKEYLASFPNVMESRWLEAIAQTEGRTNTFIDIDRQDKWVQLNQLSGRVTYNQLKLPKGQSFRIKYTDNSIGDAMIEGFNLEYEPQTYHPLTAPLK